jgi:hypothetical protein
VTLRTFRLDEMPPDMSDLTAGPDADTVLFIADTAAGRGLVAADAVSGRWRYLAAADALALQPGGREIALEVPAGSGRHNIYYGRLAPEPSRSGRTDARALKTSRG